MSLKGPILVPLDGSDLAERAVPVAAELACRAGPGAAPFYNRLVVLTGRGPSVALGNTFEVST